MSPLFDNGLVQLHQADARQLPLASQSVHCVVTSPPYFGLRVYLADSTAMIGLEETPEQWLGSMLEVMAEVWRVLRDDGVLWVNLGDSYGHGTTAVRQRSPNDGLGDGTMAAQNEVVRNGREGGQLLGIPWRFALAMQDAGWILRSDVIWAKKSAMPESLNGTRWERCRVKLTPQKIIEDGRYETEALQGGNKRAGINENWLAEYTDCPGCSKCEANDGLVLRKGSWRCTSAHEYIFQFVKGMGYYSDGEAVKTANQSLQGNANTFRGGGQYTNGLSHDNSAEYTRSSHGNDGSQAGANRRSVWNDIKPEPFGGEHYATFPSDLPRLCIQASTSEAGVCAECGAQWARVVEQAPCPYKDTRGIDGQFAETHQPVSAKKLSGPAMQQWLNEHPAKTLSWRPTCTCNADKVPATVLDPFCGTATTCLAAMRLGRRSVGVDLSEDYLHMAVKRLSGQTLPLPI